jgi:hypothetical protein
MLGDAVSAVQVARLPSRQGARQESNSSASKEDTDRYGAARAW